MAKLNDVSFNVGISVNEETVQRCCWLLGVYLTDHPDAEIRFSCGRMYGSGEYTASVFIATKEENAE